MCDFILYSSTAFRDRLPCCVVRPLPDRPCSHSRTKGPSGPIAIIPSPPPPPIPLRSLHSSSPIESTSEKDCRLSSSSSRSAQSDFSVWSDTGELTEQLVDDPLQARLKKSLGQRLLGRGHRKHAQVHYPSDLGETRSGIDKEKIKVPSPQPRRISRAERILATIMSPRGQNGHMHGLVGKPLL